MNEDNDKIIMSALLDLMIGLDKIEKNVKVLIKDMNFWRKELEMLITDMNFWKKTAINLATIVHETGEGATDD